MACNLTEILPKPWRRKPVSDTRLSRSQRRHLDPRFMDNQTVCWPWGRIHSLTLSVSFWPFFLPIFWADCSIEFDRWIAAGRLAGKRAGSALSGGGGCAAMRS
jgi:hypothetical protein